MEKRNKNWWHQINYYIHYEIYFYNLFIWCHKYCCIFL